MLDEFGDVIAPGGAGVVIASQSGHRLPRADPGQDRALATTPADELLALPMLQPDQVTDPLHAYQLAKRGNSLRVMAEAVRWGKRGARINTISPGIIITPLAKRRAHRATRRRLPAHDRAVPAGRAGPPTKSAHVGALLMGPDGAFITGSDFLMDGGVTAAYWYGDLAPVAGSARIPHVTVLANGPDPTSTAPETRHRVATRGVYGGGLTGEAFRLDVPSIDISHRDLELLLVTHLGLTLVGSVTISELDIDGGIGPAETS